MWIPTSHEGQSCSFVDSSDSRLSVQLFDTVHRSCILHLPGGGLDLEHGKHVSKAGSDGLGSFQIILWSSDLQETLDALSGSHDGGGEHARQHPCSEQLWVPAEDESRALSRSPAVDRTRRDDGNTHERMSSGLLCWSFFPKPNPKKQTANMGVTPIIGAAIPL